MLSAIATPENLAHEMISTEEPVLTQETPSLEEPVLTQETPSLEETQSRPNEITPLNTASPDLSDLANDFLDDECEFYDCIHSFANESSTVLRIISKNSERQSSAILLRTGDINNVLEVKRAGDAIFERKTHFTISSWFEDVTGLPINNAIFENVVIGNNNVPLWRVLEVAKHTQMLKNEEENHKRYSTEFNITMCASAVFMLIVLIYCTAMIVIFTHINKDE